MRYWIDGYWIEDWWREEFFLDPEAEPDLPAPIPGDTSPVVPIPVPTPIPILDSDIVPTMVDPVAHRLSDPVIQHRPTPRSYAARPSRIETEESGASVSARGIGIPTRPSTTIRKQP